MIFKGQTIFLDEDYNNLHPGISTTWNLGTLDRFTEQNPCSFAGANETYNGISYTKFVSGSSSVHYDGYLKSSNVDFITVSRTPSGVGYSGEMRIANNPSIFLRKGMVRTDAANNDGGMGSFMVYQSGDTQNQLSIYDKVADNAGLSNVTTGDITKSGSTYTITASSAKSLYMYAYGDGRNIDIPAPTSGNVLLIQSTNTTYPTDGIQEITDAINNLLGDINATSAWKTTSDGLLKYTIIDSAATINLAKNQILYMQYTPSGVGTFKFTPTTYTEPPTPGPIEQQVKITEYTISNLTGGDEYFYEWGASDDGKTYSIATTSATYSASEYIQITMQHTNSTTVKIIADMTFTNNNESIYINGTKFDTT